MPIKFNKEVSTKLFKYIRRIDIKLNPFDSRTKSARELLRQVQAKRFTEANPELKLAIDVHDRPEAPSANFRFIDGTEQFFDTQSKNVKEMLFQVHLKAMQLDAEYEMSGKSIDEADS